MAHAIKLSEAFQLLDNGPKKDRKKSPTDTKPSRGTDTSVREGSTGSGSSSNTNSTKPSKDKPKCSDRTAPPCPFGLSKKDGLRHWIPDCDRSTDGEKKTMRAEISAAKAADGPHKGTRSHSYSDAAGKGSGDKTATSGWIANTNQDPRRE